MDCSFYRNLRDPEYFLKDLQNIKIPFVFKLYIPNDSYFRPLIESYKNKINGKIVIHDYIPRTELIYELSKCDFLINFRNESSKMEPSKLIDYGISGRPILSFNKVSYKREMFLDFLRFNFEKKIDIDLDQYEIDHVIESFETLINN